MTAGQLPLHARSSRVHSGFAGREFADGHRALLLCTLTMATALARATLVHARRRRRCPPARLRPPRSCVNPYARSLKVAHSPVLAPPPCSLTANVLIRATAMRACCRRSSPTSTRDELALVHVRSPFRQRPIHIVVRPSAASIWARRLPVCSPDVVCVRAGNTPIPGR